MARLVSPEFRAPAENLETCFCMPACVHVPDGASVWPACCDGDTVTGDVCILPRQAKEHSLWRGLEVESRLQGQQMASHPHVGEAQHWQ